jgi:YHS domain-containing protein
VDAERLQQIAEQDRRSHQQRLIQSRSGQAGFKGFCPVALRDRRELIDTNPQFTATFGLQNYTFSSAEAKTAFEADPSRYAPAAGGSDVVLLVNSGEEEQGMLDYALWYRDRLYLFRSRETMAMFNKDPQRFANQY